MTIFILSIKWKSTICAIKKWLPFVERTWLSLSTGNKMASRILFFQCTGLPGRRRRARSRHRVSISCFHILRSWLLFNSQPQQQTARWPVCLWFYMCLCWAELRQNHNLSWKETPWTVSTIWVICVYSSYISTVCSAPLLAPMFNGLSRQTFMYNTRTVHHPDEITHSGFV